VFTTLSSCHAVSRSNLDVRRGDLTGYRKSYSALTAGIGMMDQGVVAGRFTAAVGYQNEDSSCCHRSILLDEPAEEVPTPDCGDFIDGGDGTWHIWGR
jgi:hypothetical protein